MKFILAINNFYYIFFIIISNIYFTSFLYFANKKRIKRLINHKNIAQLSESFNHLFFIL